MKTIQKDIKKIAKNHQHKRKCVRGGPERVRTKNKKLKENYQHHGVTRSSGIGAAEIIDKIVN